MRIEGRITLLSEKKRERQLLFLAVDWLMMLCVFSQSTGCHVRSAPVPAKGHISAKTGNGTIHLTGGESRTYSLQLAASEFLELQVVQIGIDVTVKLFDENGVLLSRVNSPTGPYGPERLFWVTDASSIYHAEIVSRDAQAPPGLCRVSFLHRKAISEDKQLVEAQKLYMEAEALLASHMKQAQEKYAASIRLIENTGHDTLLSQILNQYSLTFGAAADWDKAFQLAQTALKLARRLHARREQVESLVNIAQASKELGRYKDAQASLEDALKEHRSSPDTYLLAKIYSNYGSVFTYTAEYKSAIDYLGRAVKLYSILKLDTEAAAPLDVLGFCYQSQGDLQTAMQYFQQGLQLSRRAGDNRMQAVLFDDIGRIYQTQADYPNSITSFTEGIRLAVLVGDRSIESNTLRDLAYTYRLLGQLEKALGQYERTLNLARELNDKREEETTLISIAGCYRDQGRWQDSIDFSLQALSSARSLHDREGEGSALRMLGHAYAASQRYGEARRAYEEALIIFRDRNLRLREGSLLVSIGEVFLAEGNIQMAIEQASRALPIARETEDMRGEVFALQTLMRAWAASGQMPLAIFFGKEAVNIIQRIRANLASLDVESRRDFIAANAGIYRGLADLLLVSGRLSEAQQVLDMLKEREFIEFLRGQGADSSTGGATFTPQEAEWEKRYSEIAGQLVSIGTARGALLAKSSKSSLNKEETAQMSNLDRDIEVGNMAYARFLDQLEKAFSKTAKSAVRLAQVRESQALMEDLRELPPGTVAIYTLLGRDKYRAILITPDVQRAYEYPITNEELNRKVIAFRELVQDPVLDPRPAAKKLYDILIRPMADDLRAAGAKTIMWSLDGSLRYLPLAALYDGSRYLIEQFNLSVFTPASNARLKDRPSAGWTAVGFGVTKRHPGFPPLPFVGIELRRIISSEPEGGGILTGKNYIDESFTAESLRTAVLRRYPVVHVASHFRFEPGNAMNSFLLLGDGEHLTLTGLENLPNVFAGVQLLTLSACNTGLGDEAADGSEVEGLGVLAQKKGAKAVIASLWPVADTSTSLLMSEFYRIRLASPDLTKLDALREAQLELLRGHITSPPNGRLSETPVDDEARGEFKAAVSTAPPFQPRPGARYAHPYYWAPFFLMGNWL